MFMVSTFENGSVHGLHYMWLMESVCVVFPFQSGEADTLANRLAEAEKALALKQDHIDKLKEEMEQLRATLETIPVLNAQVKEHRIQINIYFCLCYKYLFNMHAAYSNTIAHFLFCRQRSLRWTSWLKEKPERNSIKRRKSCRRT